MIYNIMPPFPRGQTALEKHYEFYAKYHTHSINKIIHVFCLPVLLWTTTVFLKYIPWKLDTDILVIDAAFLVAAAYMIYYIILDGFLGLLMSIFLALTLWTTALFIQNVDYAWIYALGGHIISWILQFIGHEYFESNKPALFDSLFSTIRIAPLFALLEILFLCGYKKEMQIEYSVDSD
jgi:uncharacterized membrane protein YGL010W